MRFSLSDLSFAIDPTAHLARRLYLSAFTSRSYAALDERPLGRFVVAATSAIV